MFNTITGTPKSGRTTTACAIARSYKNVIFFHSDDYLDGLDLFPKVKGKYNNIDLQYGFRIEELESQIAEKNPDLVIIDIPNQSSQNISEIAYKTHTKIILVETTHK